MPLRAHGPFLVFALLFVVHIVIFSFVAGAMFAEKAGAYGVLQFTMDLAVMSAILVLMFFKYTHEDAEPSRAPNLTCFSIIFSLSLTGAVGLTIGSSGDGFCEEFLSTHPDTCMEASLVLGMSWASAAIAVAGILVSWLDKYPGAERLYVPRRSAREIELLNQRSTWESTNAKLPRTHITRPPASHATSHLQGRHPTQSPRQLVLSQTIPRDLQKVPLDRPPTYMSSPSPRNPAPLMLHREVNASVGQAPRNQSTLMRTDDLRTPPDHLSSVRWNADYISEREIWKQKCLRPLV